VESEVLDIAITALDVRYGRLRLPQPRAEEAMAASMRRFGQVSAVVGCARGETFALVDGFKRLHAARALGLDTLRVRPLALTERAALAAVYGLNRGNRGLVDLEEAMVVRELVRAQGMTQPEVGELLGHDKSWVCRRLMLVERLDEKVQQDVRVGLVPVSVAREVVRLPRGNQPELAAAVHRNALTSREAATLVTLFEGTADRAQQQALLDDPRTALDAHRGDAPKNPHDPRLGPACNALRRQVAMVLEGLARLDRQAQGVEASRWTEPERAVLAPVLRQVAGLASRTAVNVLSVASAMEAGVGARR
jgi:ParB-like chromosome segregation protein Spo0J